MKTPDLASGDWLEWQLHAVTQKAPSPMSHENRETQTPDSLATAISLGGSCTLSKTAEKTGHQPPQC